MSADPYRESAAPERDELRRERFLTVKVTALVSGLLAAGISLSLWCATHGDAAKRVCVDSAEWCKWSDPEYDGSGACCGEARS